MNLARIKPSKHFVAFGFTALMLMAGCSNKPTRITIPDWDPTGFASQILEKLDKNGNGFVDKDELGQAPGLAFGARFIDKDGDGKLSREELVARFTRYRDRRLGLISKEFRVTYNGRPLNGAEVRLIPEFFLTETIEPATGTTSAQGLVRPSIADQPLPLMRVGYYRVEVTSPTAKLPTKFNSSSTIGVEVSPFSDAPMTSDTIEIPLRDTK